MRGNLLFAATEEALWPAPLPDGLSARHSAKQ